MNRRNVLTNINNLGVSSNEYTVKYTFWRNLKKLLENDVNLQELFDVITNSISITAYQSGEAYQFGEIVWYLYTSKERVVLLKSLFDDNRTEPESGGKSFEDNGWEVIGVDVDVYSIGILQKLKRVGLQYFNNHVQTDHTYGELNFDNIDQKLMRSDMSNRNKDRDYFFFPYTTGFLPVENNDNVILNGCYRYYDNGLLEYDIIFKLGYVGDVDIMGCETQALTCNNLTLENNYNMSRYFYNLESYNIFNHKNDTETNYSQIDTTIQLNRNDYVNTYSAKINLPIAFINTNYMVFTGNVLCQNNDFAQNRITCGKNSLTFTQKTPNSITAVLVTYPDDGHWLASGYNTKNGGLVANSFRCKLIGRASKKDE